MLSCKESTRLISEGLDHKLRFTQRLGLRLHVMMCGACRAYRRQIRALHRLIVRRLRSGRPGGLKSLSEESRQRIKRTLRDHSH